MSTLIGSEDMTEQAGEETLEERLERLAREVDQLRTENQRLHQMLKEERAWREANERAVAYAERLLEHGVDDRVDGLVERIEGEIEPAIRDERKAGLRRDTHLERKIGILAEKAGVDLTDQMAMHEDKIAHVLRYGIQDAVDRPYSVHYRAQDLLSHFEDWWTERPDERGVRLTIERPEAQRRLNELRDENLKPNQVGRVFEKVVEWADPARLASVQTTEEGIQRLVLYRDRGESDRR
jgi:hypothetical protein